ncbi:MAG: hypothetical protein HQ495_03480 [Alphaproteobacteria bacterium]|nr:hypothetical protein [Alphaproteobacteria bacterium]
MPITYRIEPDNEFIEFVLTGTIGVTELIRTVRDLFDDPTFDPMFDVLVDSRAARIGRVSFKLAEAMIAISVGNEARRMAIVMPEGDGARHAARFVALRNDARRVRGFSDRAVAEDWLNNPVLGAGCAAQT